MTKNFILNVLLNLAILFLVFSAFSAYNEGNILFVGLCIAFSVVLLYLKVVLLKHVKREAEKVQMKQKNKKSKT